MTQRDDKSEPPFQAHRRYYLFLKLAVLAAAAFLAIRYLSTMLVG